MMPKTVTLQLAAGDDNGVCASQTPLAGGAMTINGALSSGGVATFDVARRVLFTFAADESGRTFTVTGPNRNGTAISEEVAGTAATAMTEQDFAGVTEVTIDDASAGAIIVGTGTVGSSKWIPVSVNLNPFSVGVGCVVGGTVNYTVEHTYDDVQSNTANATAFSSATIAAKSTDFDGAYTSPVRAVRLKVNSGTDPVTMTVIQAG